MEQRPLRLGDIVDDYCPRERRITNHAIVAIVDNTIRQTRCSTCDAEHVYKEARPPRRRKTDTVAEAPGQLVPPRAAPAEAEVAVEEAATAAEPEFDDDSSSDVAEAVEPVALSAMAEPGESAREEPADADAEQPRDDAPDGWLAHRRLIRATLPRVEGEAPARPIPEFTMHQRQTRGSHMFRSGPGGNGPGGNGSGNARGGFRQGQGGNGNSSGNGHGGGRGRNRSGRRHKRSR